MELLRELQDPQVLTHPRLGRPRLRAEHSLSDPLDGQPGVQQPLVAAGTRHRIEIAALVVLDQCLDEQVRLLIFIAEHAGRTIAGISMPAQP